MPRYTAVQGEHCRCGKDQFMACLRAQDAEHDRRAKVMKEAEAGSDDAPGAPLAWALDAMGVRSERVEAALGSAVARHTDLEALVSVEPVASTGDAG